MSNEKNKPITIRFLLDLQAEEAVHVDVTFPNLKQAKRALQDVAAANGALVALTVGEDLPVLIRTADISAAYVLTQQEDD